jgi:uncharacterized protein YqgC (DUF456 family)
MTDDMAMASSATIGGVVGCFIGVFIGLCLSPSFEADKYEQIITDKPNTVAAIRSKVLAERAIEQDE